MIAQQEMQTHHFAREGLGVDTEGPGTCGQHFEDVLLDVLLKIFFLVRCTLKLRFSYKQRTKLLLFTVVIYSLQKKKYFSRQYFHTDRFLYQNLVIFSVVEKGFYICSSFSEIQVYLHQSIFERWITFHRYIFLQMTDFSRWYTILRRNMSLFSVVFFIETFLYTIVFLIV